MNELTAEQVRECVESLYWEGYNDGYVHRGHGIEETDWQAIADKFKELNEYHVFQYEQASEDCDRLQAQVDELTDERYRYKLQCERYEAKIDELTDMLGFGTCEIIAIFIHGKYDRVEFSCGHSVKWMEPGPELPKFCPKCGRKVVKP